MKNSHKRILSIAMVSAMSLCALPQSSAILLRPAIVACAADEEDITVNYDVKDDGTLKITGPKDDKTTSVRIPAVINGKTVTEIGSWAFAQKENLTSVELPDTVTVIGSSAFNLSKKLNDINIPKNVTSIGATAFTSCALTSVKLPDSLTNIGDQAFASCADLAEIDIKSGVTSIGSSAFRDTAWLNAKKESETLVVVNGILIDGTAASGDVEIPGSVKSICGMAFSGCNTITSVTVKNGVTSIGENAFNMCSQLKKVSLPSTVTSIGAQAFSVCTSLTDINIPDSVTFMDGSTFFRCEKLKEITIPGSIDTIISRSFAACTSLESVVIKDGVKTISSQAFTGSNNIKTIVIPESVTDIRFGAISSNDSLTIVGKPGSAAEKYATDYNIKFQGIYEGFDTISLTLSDDIGLNFYLDTDMVTDDNASQYRVKLSGKCAEDGITLTPAKRNGKYCVTANISADHMDEEITAVLEHKNGSSWEKAGEAAYSANKYLMNVDTTGSTELAALVKTVKTYGEVTKAYVNDEAMPEVADNSDKYTTSEFNIIKNTNDKLSLVLDSRFAVRLYISGLTESSTGKMGSTVLTAKKAANGEYFFEVTGISPTELTAKISIDYGAQTFTFKPLSWCYLVNKNGSTGKNKAMADILYQYYADAIAYKNTLS